MTSYLIVSSGEEVTKMSKIAANYMSSFDFYVDFLSTFPFELVGNVSGLDGVESYLTFASIMKVLKVLRIRKIGTMITQMSVTVETKALAKIIYYMFAIIVILHTLACLLWFSLKTDNLWVAPTDFGAIRSRQHDPWSMTDDIYSQYYDLKDKFSLFIFQFLQMWYHSALLIMLVDITARTKMQITVLSILYICMAIVNAIVFGLLFDLIEVLNRK